MSLAERLVLTPQYRTEPGAPYNVVSVSVFRSPGAPPTTSEGAQRKGLCELAKSVGAINAAAGYPDMVLRVYYDESVRVHDGWREVLDPLSTMSHVQLVLYDCRPCFESRGANDQGDLFGHLFGTLVRFFPMFEYPENVNVGWVYVTDVASPFGTKQWKVLQTFLDSPSQLHFKTTACQGSKLLRSRRGVPSSSNKKPREDMWRHVSPSVVIAKARYPTSLLENFYEWLRETRETPLRIGLDELFVNTTFLAHVDAAGTPYSYTLESDISRTMREAEPQTGSQADRFIRLVHQITGHRAKTVSAAKARAHSVLSTPIRFAQNLAPHRAYVEALRKIEKEGSWERYGMTGESVRCVLRHGFGDSYPFVMPDHVTQTFEEAVSEHFPSTRAYRLRPFQLAEMERLLTTKVFGGRMTLKHLVQELVAPSSPAERVQTDSPIAPARAFLFGGWTRDLACLEEGGEVKSRDVDIHLYARDPALAVHRVASRHGDDASVASSSAMRLVKVDSEDYESIDISALVLPVKTVSDATFNALHLDMGRGVLYDLFGNGVEDSRARVYRSTTKLDSGNAAISSMWRHVKFMLRGYSVVDETVVDVYRAVFGAVDASRDWWTSVPFVSQIDPDRFPEALQCLVNDVDRLHARGLLEFTGGDMATKLTFEGVMVNAKICSAKVSGPEAKGAVNTDTASKRRRKGKRG